MSYTAIDNKLWDVRKWLMNRYGVDASARMIDPLTWYIDTGRASVDFLRRLCEAKTFVVGRLLAKEGSIDETINRIKARI